MKKLINYKKKTIIIEILGCLTHKKELLNKLKTNFVKVTLHKFGCRIIQKTIDVKI